MTTDPAVLRQQMVDAVLADDCLDGLRAALMPWLPTLRAVPRHVFIPGTVWVDNETDTGPPLVALHRAQDPDRWLRLAYEMNEGSRPRSTTDSPARGCPPARRRVRSSSR